MTIEYILTFGKGSQVFGSLENAPAGTWTTKIEAIRWFKNRVKGFRRQLLKVSLFFYNCEESEVPRWVIQCNGKLWDDDLGTEMFNPYR